MAETRTVVKQAKKPRWANLDLSNAKLIDMYRQMLLIRRFEERAAQEYGKSKIGGFCHLYIGQEAVGVGAIAALRKDDYIFSSYRDHGHALAAGMDPNGIMAELFGKFTGCSKGMGGSMHMFDASKNFMGGYGIVGGHVPLASGTAFASKYTGKDSVTICFFGEAAANQGVFHETLNLAALWKLPVIFICENNRYGMGTAVERASAVWDIYQKASAYDMDRLAVDGMDVLEMYRVIKRAADRARKNSSPTMIEARTYRFRGHSMSDPIHGHYRTKEEVEEQKKSDPIPGFAAELLAAGVLTQAMIDQMELEIKNIVNEAVDFADHSPEPPAEFLFENVYV
ncbi:MAG: pyruvate dehydrogenase (acetyl-transferring) E1 component subunit alpha [Ignavibacteriales bacterium]|nr:pyruvate dehydrogenase (acetyl-transferring) E1 component subunit alpha [Ignavibacteriales bacterium]